jgi:hypothetical protein
MKFEPKVVRIFAILILSLIFALHGKSQTNMVFYSIENQFNSSNLNPAYLVSRNQSFFSIFPLAGVNVGYNNQEAIKDMIAKILQGDQTNSDFREVFDGMIKLDLFYQKLETPLLNLGYNSDFGSFNFRIQENIQLMTVLKGGFSEFLTNSSAQSIPINKPQLFPAQALHYREYSLGYARDVVKNRLSVGLRAKLYFGKLSVSSNVQGEVAKKDNNFFLQIRDQVKFSFPMNIVDKDGLLSSVELPDDFSVGNYLMNSKNVGVGFDIGLTYKITPDLTLSASMVDIGKINWKNNLKQITFDGEYKFPEEFIVSGDNNTLTKESGFSNETTDLTELYKIKIDESPYSARLPVTFYSGLKYRLNPKLNISLVDRVISAQAMHFNSLSVTGIYDINKKLTISSGYSILGKSYSNIPFAILYTGEAGQYYLGTDNLLSLVAPSTAEFSGITFGMCFFLFRSKVNYKELEYLPFYREKERP